MKFNFGYTGDKLIVLAEGRVDRKRGWQRAIKDPRFEPGKTKIITCLAEGNIISNPADIADLIMYIANVMPAAWAVFTTDPLVFDNCQVGVAYFRAKGIDAKAFSDFDKLFKWIDKEKFIDERR